MQNICSSIELHLRTWSKSFDRILFFFIISWQKYLRINDYPIIKIKVYSVLLLKHKSKQLFIAISRLIMSSIFAEALVTALNQHCRKLCFSLISMFFSLGSLGDLSPAHALCCLPWDLHYWLLRPFIVCARAPVQTCSVATCTHYAFREITPHFCIVYPLLLSCVIYQSGSYESINEKTVWIIIDWFNDKAQWPT